jgi:nicotinamidase-related amidase
MNDSFRQDVQAPGQSLLLSLRRRVERAGGSGEWEPVTVAQEFPAQATGLIICDVWDKHWSRGASERVEAMVPRMNEVVNAARRQGVLIIHAPSDTLEFYRDHPARRRVLDVPTVELPAPLDLPDPPLPIDDSDGGSDTGETSWYKAWTRQHPGIEIRETDAISDSGPEVYSLLRQHGIQNALVLGVHTNMCILNRSFGIKNLVRWRFNTTLVRDLTDTMYNPAMPPYVSHERGTELVVEHIEKHWASTTTSDAILTACQANGG